MHGECPITYSRVKESLWDGRHCSHGYCARLRFERSGDVVLCIWARLFTLTLSLSIQVCKLAPLNLFPGEALRWTGIQSSSLHVALPFPRKKTKQNKTNQNKKNKTKKKKNGRVGKSEKGWHESCYVQSE